MSTSIQWSRYCAPLGAAVHIVDGFLIPPDPAWSTARDRCRPLSELDSVAALTILGEPGLGKSTTIEHEVARTRPGAQSQLIDLKSFGSESRLQERLRACIHSRDEAAPQLLYLFIDSIDECELKPSVLNGILSEALSTIQISRLRLRLICRTAEWPITLEGVLEQYWPGDQHAFFELLPLTRADVFAAAADRLSDAAAFMAAIDNSHAGYFATKPITLFALLKSYARAGCLPKSTTLLYEDSCRILAEELGPSRRDAGQVGTLTADQRLMLSARIAAHTTFCAQHRIWLGPNHEAPQSSFTLKDLAGGTEVVEGVVVDVTETSIRETLQTSLFSSRGERLLGLAHKAYEEFLAAWYLRKRGAPVAQLEDLLASADGAVVPNLLESAAWAASWNEEFRKRLMHNDPFVLLRTDAATLSGSERSQLVGELLAGLIGERFTDHDWGIRNFYIRLDHMGLADQLRAVLVDHALPIVPRRFAIDVAEACNLAILQDVIMAIALDASEGHSLRKEAAHAMIELGDPSHRRLLAPLLRLSPAEDPDDEIYGATLRAMWPDVLSTEELIPLLRTPRRPSFGGNYSVFLRSFPPRLLLPDLPLVLSWASSECSKVELEQRMDSLVDDVLVAAAPYTDADAVREPLARIVWNRLARHQSLLADRTNKTSNLRFLTDDTARRALVLEVLSMITPLDSNTGYIALARRSTLMRESDVNWLAAEVLRRSEGDTRTRIAQLLYWTFFSVVSKDNRQQVFDLILTTAEMVNEVRVAFSSEIEPIPLNSERAQALKEQLKAEQEWEAQVERPLLSPTPMERWTSALLECERGTVDSWPKAYGWLFLSPDGNAQVAERFQAEADRSHGWIAADKPIRARLTLAARRFVERHLPSANAPEDGNMPWADFVGYGSLVLLQRTGNTQQCPLSADTWKRWAAIIYSYPRASGTESGPHKELRECAYEHAPMESIEAVCSRALDENKVHRQVLSLSWLPERALQDATACRSLLDLAKDANLGVDSLAEVLGTLLKHGNRDAVGYARSLLPVCPPVEAEERNRAIVAAAELLSHAPTENWVFVWTVMRAETEFGKEVVQQVARRAMRHSSSKPLAKLIPEKSVAELFAWIEECYPRAEDPDQDGWHSVTSREDVATFRDSLLHGLVQRGTDAALAAISELLVKCSHLPWIKWQLLEARKVVRTTSWEPLTSMELRSLLESADRRVVVTADQLLQLLCVCIERLQIRLDHEASYSRDYWDQQHNSNAFRPVTEGRFRDLVARALMDALKGHRLIVNREVELIPHPAGRLGERTDIMIEAVGVAGSAEERLSIVIECKGCWNADVVESLTTQLLDRYLKRTTCTHGIYLVALFDSSRWGADDSRRGKCSGIARSLPTLHAEALAASEGGYEVRLATLRIGL
ncbi:MAG: hypothetical protein ABL982_09455 [Vicinamibacterales bacterium]